MRIFPIKKAIASIRMPDPADVGIVLAGIMATAICGAMEISFMKNGLDGLTGTNQASKSIVDLDNLGKLHFPNNQATLVAIADGLKSKAAAAGYKSALAYLK